MGNVLTRFACAAAVAAVLAAGCSSHTAAPAPTPPAGTPSQVVDRVTHAIYDDRADDARAAFDDALKSQIQDYQVRFLSQSMHGYGAYDGLKSVSADPDRARYVYRAVFAHGKMQVEARFDGTGRLAAYRLIPG